MDAGRFDDIARVLGASRSRRAGLKAALGALVGLAARPAAAKENRAESKCNVCPNGCPYSSIGEALFFEESDLRVKPGTYKEFGLVVGPGTASTKTVSIRSCASGGHEKVVVDAEGKGRVFTVNPGVSLHLEDLVIQNGDATRGGGNDQGGGIYFHESIKSGAVLRRVSVIGCKAGDGGGIYVGWLAGIQLEDCLFAGNVATGSGGGMYLKYAFLAIVSNMTFQDNTASAAGGGV